MTSSRLKILVSCGVFLGLEIAHTSTGIFLCQRKYALNILTDSGLLGCKLASSPCDSSSRLAIKIGTPLPDPGIYRRLVGQRPLKRKGGSVLLKNGSVLINECLTLEYLSTKLG